MITAHDRLGHLAGHSVFGDPDIRHHIHEMICQAGNDTLVNNDAQNRFAALIRSAEIIRFPTAKHEIANSEDDILELYWSSVFDFFENQLKKIKN